MQCVLFKDQQEEKLKVGHGTILPSGPDTTINGEAIVRLSLDSVLEGARYVIAPYLPSEEASSYLGDLIGSHLNCPNMLLNLLERYKI